MATIEVDLQAYVTWSRSVLRQHLTERAGSRLGGRGRISRSDVARWILEEHEGLARNFATLGVRSEWQELGSIMGELLPAASEALAWVRDETPGDPSPLASSNEEFHGGRSEVLEAAVYLATEWALPLLQVSALSRSLGIDAVQHLLSEQNAPAWVRQRLDTGGLSGSGYSAVRTVILAGMGSHDEASATVLGSWLVSGSEAFMISAWSKLKKASARGGTATAGPEHTTSASEQVSDFVRRVESEHEWLVSGEDVTAEQLELERQLAREVIEGLLADADGRKLLDRVARSERVKASGNISPGEILASEFYARFVAGNRRFKSRELLWTALKFTARDIAIGRDEFSSIATTHVGFDPQLGARAATDGVGLGRPVDDRPFDEGPSTALEEAWESFGAKADRPAMTMSLAHEVIRARSACSWPAGPGRPPAPRGDGSMRNWVTAVRIDHSISTRTPVETLPSITVLLAVVTDFALHLRALSAATGND